MGADISRSVPAKCIEIEPSSNPKESGVYINSIRMQENGGRPIATFRSQPRSFTMTDILDNCVKAFPDSDCQGERKVNTDGSYGDYKWLSFRQFRQQCLYFAAGMQSLGIKKGDKIGIFSHSSIQWQIVNFSSLYIGAIPVTVSDSFYPDSSKYIINHSKCRMLVLNGLNVDKFKTYMKDLKNLEFVVAISYIKSESIMTFDEIIERGKQFKEFEQYHPVKDDIALIMYTSGNSGMPKGCIISHGALIAGATGLSSAGFSVSTNDTYFSFLPLSHIFELTTQLTLMTHGVRVGYFSGDMRNILKDCQALQPTVFSGVPKVFNRIVENIYKEIEESNFMFRFIVKSALKTKIDSILNGEPSSLFSDIFIFSKFKKILGGRIRLLICGGAPILPENYTLLRAIITQNIIQGYGLTEICAAGCLQEVGSQSTALVGPCAICVDMKFREVEGLNYDPKGPTPSGELLFRGPNLFKGYLDDPESTNEAFVDGWLATGDIGILTSEGFIQIIDNVKQLVKLSNGEYISLKKLREIYSETNGVENIFIFSNSHKNQPVAVVVPTQNYMDDWLARGIESFETSEIAKSEILRNLNERANALRLRPHEHICNIIIDKEAFTVQNGLLVSPTQQDFQAIRLKYESRLFDLYSEKNLLPQ